MVFFHCCDNNHDPRGLLDPENHWSTPWGPPDHGPCDKCGQSGEVQYRCRSCELAEADPACPACDGRVRFREICPACEGDGEVTRTRRRGISVFPTRAGLYRYLAERDGDLAGSMIIELEGELSGDRDLDADAGAILVCPTRIVAARPLEEEELATFRTAAS